MTQGECVNRLQGAALLCAIVIPIIAGPAVAASGDDTMKAIQALGWKRGPAKGSLGTKASLDLPEGSGLLDEKDSSRFLELSGNLPTDGMNVLASGSWWAVFDFNPIGYVKDDEKIDADALLKQLKDGDEPSNEERRKHNIPALYTEGWYIPPRYDVATKRLEWALRLRAADDPAPIINYTVRLLGRGGYERATLVTSPKNLDKDVPEFKQVLTGFHFGAGESYSEFKSGDRVAEIGLAALVAGGAAAVATKAGLWKVIGAFLAASWKLVVAAGVFVMAAVGKLFKRKTRE